MGYHKREIRKGVYGEISKIQEELQETEDAESQKNPVMVLVELSDILGAIDGYLKKKFKGVVTLDDLVTMARATQGAFESGARR